VNNPIRRVAGFAGLLLIALLANLTYVQFFQADDLRNRPGNTRTVLAEYDRERGAITVAGRGVATSRPNTNEASNFEFERVYPYGELFAHATGFYSLVYGSTGLERAENEVLSGTDDRLLVDRLTQLVAGRSVKGGSVVTTLNSDAQRAAFDGLNGRNGAVIALDPTTGAILAMVSSPSFDPNPLASTNTATERSAYQELVNDENSPLLNRAIAQLYPPGSTFKLVTAAAALSTGDYTKSSVVPAPASIPLPLSDKRLPNYDNTACGPGNKTTLENAMRISCNTAFALLGLELGDDALREQAEAFGFNSGFDIPLKAATSVFPEDLDGAQTAMAAIGQFDVRSSVMQMAMVAAAIGNRGIVMEPYLVAQKRGPDLSVLEATTPTEFGQAVTPQVAAQLRDMMVTVVDNGTGRRAQISGVEVGGKTGTAQTGEDAKPHAWFVSFAPADDPKVAVAVILENGGGATEISGGRLAAPIARAVMEAVLNR
jgi:peptidoglycan glycosyltransferase